MSLWSTFKELAKDLLDDLNAYHTRDAVEVDEITNSTYGMHFYDSVIVFEQGRLPRRHDLLVGFDANGRKV